ncbi:MAG: 5-formyltetrahydrofolate cyclo-ligase [Parvularculaceae bacterium]
MLPPIKFPGFGRAGGGKDLLRLKQKRERSAAAADPGRAATAARHAARLFLDNVPLPEDAVVALYHPIGDELDTEPLLDALVERGVAIALPRTPKGRNAVLSFHRFAPGDPLLEGRFGVLEPAADAPIVAPDVVICPLLGFDRAGARLGYGGGHYDRALADLRRGDGAGPIAVGYAYGAQEVDALPAEDHDQRLDWVVTERRATAF